MSGTINATHIRALTALEIRSHVSRGELSTLDVAEAFLDAIATQDSKIHAFSWHSPDFVRKRAAELDSIQQAGQPLGRLHGLPVALKDVIDTAGIPTENGTKPDSGRIPTLDAWIVSRLKAEGALIIGKSVTAELAFMHPGPTRNPINLAFTPGGSSSGSAAAVAAGMAPLAIGTQTGGSVIRPAAFCGVVGFKPTFGAIPRTGVLKQSQSLDTIGTFGRTVSNAALIAEVLFGHDPEDRATSPHPFPNLTSIVDASPSEPPRFAFLKMPGFDSAESETKTSLAKLVGHLGKNCIEAPIPNACKDAVELRMRINLAELAHNYRRYEGSSASQTLKTAIKKGHAITARDYLAALDAIPEMQSGIDEIFDDCDVILCPAALGPAPEGLESTGDSIFNGLWTMTGHPAISLPLFKSHNGLPIGVQLVGKRNCEAKLLQAAHWLAQNYEM